jgi:AcrR family transcriptional regulator
MDAKSKRMLERNQQIEKRKEEILNAAIEEFIQNGIDNSKISDIAKRAVVGSATVYRYFETKPKLVIECATKLWNGEMNSILPRINVESLDSLNGFEQVQKVLNIFVAIYEECPFLLRLLEQFDNYIVNEKIPREQLSQYDVGIAASRDLILKAIKAGQEDGTIRRDFDVLQFYMTIAHAIMALSQKLLMRGDILPSDKEIDGKTQISMLIEVALDFIKVKGRQD